LLEDEQIKLSGCVSDLLGVSSRRMLHALADGETKPAKLAAPSGDRAAIGQPYASESTGQQ
jgi:hypothetical protein